MPYPNETIPNNEGTADETSLLFLPDVADETVTTTKTTKKQHPSRAVVAGGVAGVLLLAIAGGYYSLDTVAAPAPASDSGSLSIASNRFGMGSCFVYDSFHGVSLHAFKQDQLFQTCYADGSSTSTTRCWSNSFLYESNPFPWWFDPTWWINPIGYAVDGWYECEPVGDGWVATDPLPDGSCGLPCTMFRCPADCDQLIISNNCCGLEYDDDD